MKIFTPFKHALVLTLSLMALMPSALNAQVAINATNFPDEVFRNWLLDANNIKGYGADGVLTATEIAEIDDIYINGSLSTSVSDIADMTGIEYFTALKSLTCFRNKITSLDLSKNTALKTLGITGNPLTSLTVNDDLEQFLCGQDQDLSIFNISRFTKLTLLSIRDVDLTSIDLSVFPKLETLFLQDLKLTTLDLSNNTELQWLRCFGNQLTSLDLSNNPKLNKIECYHNLIRGAGMDVLVNSLPTATDGLILVYQDETPIGNEMTTEQVATAKAKGWQVQWDPNGTYDWLDYPGTASTGIAINATNFPDETFRNWLLDANNIKGYGADGVLTATEIAEIDDIYINGSLSTSVSDIADMTGIEYFTALKSLTCFRNKITSLDLSKNTALKTLGITGNPLTSLTVNDDLEQFLCGQGQDVSIFNISRFTKLTLLSIIDVDLTSIDLTVFPKLEYLFLQNLKLTTLDLSNNTELQRLRCFGNQLTSLDLSNNPKLNKIECYHNLIRGAGMDVLVNSLPTVTDGLILAYQDETPIGNEMTTEQVATAKAKGWQVQWDADGTYNWQDYSGTDGVNAVQMSQKAAEWYSLDGRRVQQPAQKGIFVTNGRKVMVK